MERSYIRTNLYWFSFSISMETRWRQISLYSSGKVPKPLIFPIVLGKCQITSGHCIQVAGTNIFSNYDKCIDQYGLDWKSVDCISMDFVAVYIPMDWESADSRECIAPTTIQPTNFVTFIFFGINMTFIQHHGSHHYLLFPRAQILLFIFEHFAWYVFCRGPGLVRASWSGHVQVSDFHDFSNLIFSSIYLFFVISYFNWETFRSGFSSKCSTV